MGQKNANALGINNMSGNVSGSATLTGTGSGLLTVCFVAVAGTIRQILRRLAA